MILPAAAAAGADTTTSASCSAQQSVTQNRPDGVHDTYTIKVLRDTCGRYIVAEANWGYLGRIGNGFVQGNVVYQVGKTSTSHGRPGAIGAIQWGFDYKADGHWFYHQIGSGYVFFGPGHVRTLAVDKPAASCYVSALHNGAGAGSYTLNVTADPCGLPVNATALCAYFIGGKHWRHGPVIHGRGKSVSQCGYGVANISAWGYDVVYQGHTNYIQLGNI